MMQRRSFLTLLGGAAAALPLAARAQQRPAMPVIGYLGWRTEAGDASNVEAFRQGLRESGFILGQNVAIEFRWADGQNNRLPALAADLVRRRVNVLVCAGGPAVPVAKAATSTIPIVFSTGDDPIERGLVASLNRPGGNLTGMTTWTRALVAKRVGLLRDLVPEVTQFAYLIDAREDNDYQITDAQAAARQIGRELVILRARADADIDAAFATMVERSVGALLATANSVWKGFIIALAMRHRLPAIYDTREWAVAGGLISYGTSFTDSYHHVGAYAGRILKGEKPADLPVMQPTRFELVINLSTAKALKLTIPPGILAIADEVIE
jgi:putative ABC transport system substrate-binding protein